MSVIEFVHSNIIKKYSIKEERKKYLRNSILINKVIS